MYLGTHTRMELLRAEAFLRMLADKTGGQALVGHQYRLVYDSQPRLDRDFQELKVEAFVIEEDRRKEFAVRVREGWWEG